MKLRNKEIGFIYTGAFKTIECSIEQMNNIVSLGNDVYPIMSINAFKTISNNIKKRIEIICNKRIVHTFKKIDNLDLGIIEPCTGNTLSKLANNIIDTPALYIANTILIKNKPLVIGISSFKGISSSLENIGKLINRKNVFFVPFRQTNPITRPDYLMFSPSLTIKTLEYGINNLQLQPILI